MIEPLQTFYFEGSPYERVERPWICGRTATGNPCPLGPDRKGRCRGTFACVPALETDAKGRSSYRCMRLASLGGPCAAGPTEKGQCCNPQPPCQPVRSVRARRGLVTSMTVATTLALLLVLLFGEGRLEFVSPGALSLAHEQAGARCADCHAAAAKGAFAWPAKALSGEGGVVDGEGCLKCHRFGNEADAFAAHTLPRDERARLTSAARTGSGGGALPWTMSAARFLFSDSGAANQKIACTTCHKEHQGTDVRLSVMEERRCQSCHVKRFVSFGNGHPEFAGYPTDRRTPIALDHVSHLHQHFVKKEKSFSCSDCHAPAPDGRGMALRAGLLESSCVQCHASEARSTDDVAVVLNLPRLDVETLGLEGWPAKEGERRWKPSPWMSLLLKPADEALDRLTEGGRKKVKLGKLKKADAAVRADARRVAGAIMAFVQSATVADQAALGDLFGVPADDPLVRELWARGFVEAIRDASSRWFAPPATPKEETQTPRTKDAPGRFFLAKDGVSYRPEGHADPVVSLLASRVVRHYGRRPEGLAQLLDDRVVANCTKCHNVDRGPDGAATVHWRGAQYPAHAPRRPVAFAHPPHLRTSMAFPGAAAPGSEETCVACHHLRGEDGGTQPNQQFFSAGVTDPARGVSSFAGIRKATCMHCHTPERAGESCLTCHFYHAGTLSLAPR